MLMYVGGVVLLRNFPFVGEVRLTVLTRFRERAIRSYRTIDTSNCYVYILRSSSEQLKNKGRRPVTVKADHNQNGCLFVRHDPPEILLPILLFSTEGRGGVYLVTNRQGAI